MNETEHVENIQPPLSETIIKDKQGRVLIHISNTGRVAVARHTNVSDKFRENVMKLCRGILEDNQNLEMDLEKIRKFIYFESDDDEFCS